ncbi:Hypothetical protein PHPALM_17174 [Phytophthora palmivora]|uniref:RNase H type-1 domain-containing protein n=1 Tax=Phytophthora palmivora TaxID=4796 RepID=A0A2P4XMZ7_9STRA|nr:Hypothetical protein PHPALM_17174 [Phytophthora palmivora]
MLLYVRREVRRWEEVSPGRVTPPSVVYDPTPKPDANSYFAAAYATGDYFKWRLALANQDEAWISEFHAARWGVGTAQDLTATTIPQSVMTARECVAILQTLFFEAGFEFVNLIPSWSTTRASRIPESLVRSVVEEVQNFIAVELVEWRMVIAGVSFQVNFEDHVAQSVQEQVPRLEYHKEDGDGDLLMTDYDADLLGREFVLRFRVTGLRISRSPRGSSDGEPQSKRSQHGPPRPQTPSTPSALSTPSLPSLPAYKSSAGTLLQNSTPLNSMSNGRESLEMEAKDAVPDSIPSVIGTSRASDESTASGAQTSYGSSSSSSMRSLGQQVGALALVAQSASGFTAVWDLGFQVTRTVVPHRLVAVDQEDVEMASSVHSDPEIASRKAGLPRFPAATAEPKPKVSSPMSGFGGARNVTSDERSQRQSSKSETRSRHSTKSRKSAASSRSSVSRQLGSASSASSRSGPAQIELNVLRQQQEWQARMEQEQREFLARERLDALEQIARREAERRAQDVEVDQAQSPTETQGATQSVTEAVRLERERLDATYAERWQQREAEADAERARWASEVHAGWKEQMSTMEQKVQELEAEREREREASQNIQRRTTAAKTSQDSKADSKRSVPKKHRQEKKKRRDVNPPSDSDPSSDSSDDDSSSESSNDSSDENPGVNLTAASATQAGTTLLTFRPYINSNTLGEFDTKASLRERVHWWERFANMAAQGGWSTKMRTQELKLKLSGAARDWFNQLPKHIQRDWKELASAFRKKYCKARSSALDFFYRLNSAAGKADIDFRKSSKRLEKHIRRFITKLRDTRLKTSLQGQRFRNIADFEYALEQDEEVWSRSDRDAPPPRVRDFRADNIPQGRFKSKRTGRAYVTRGDVSDSESDEDPEIHARFQEITDEPSVSARTSTRKLGLRLKSHKQTKVSGMGGVPTYIGASAQVKITLGSRVVYLLDVWVANIGEGIEVLLGMSFMFAAGVRISIREGLVTLPDEETIVMCGWNPEERLGVDMPVETTGSWYLAPGESKVVKISYGLTNPQREVVWVGRGDRWVTRLVYAAKSWPVAVKVVNISGKDVWIDNRTPVARIVEYGSFPRAGRFVRPGSFAYREWQTLILENVQSREGRMRAERLAALEPPCVDTPKYLWPTKLLSRSAKGPDTALLASILRKPKIRRVRFAEDASTQTDEMTPRGFRESRDMAVDTNDLGNNSLTDEVASTASHAAETPSLRVELGSDSQGWRGEESDSLDFVADDDDSLDAVEDYWGIPISGMHGTPLERLKQQYERCMRLSTEGLDYEPAVYMREGSELLSQLRDQLVMLPEIKDLTPECKIEEADVGVPGKTTPEMEDQVRRILEYHRKIFLGYGNAAPPPARGVVCDLDVGDAKPVAQRPRSIAPHLWTKVYKLLKKLLENGLIETSTSPWAFPIVIVLKKNGVDIRMCIDYHAQGFILGNVTVNDAEYHGLLKGLTLAIERGVQDIVVVGDSRIAIQQAQGLINCNQPNLQRKLAEYEVLKTKFKYVRLVHVKREFNQAADYLTSKTLALGESCKVEDADERTHLQLVSKIHKKLVKPKLLQNDAGIQKDDPQGVGTLSVPGPECAPLPTAVKVFAVTIRAQTQESEIQGEPMGPLEYQAERWRRIKVPQDKDDYLLQLKDFLRGMLKPGNSRKSLMISYQRGLISFESVNQRSAPGHGRRTQTGSTESSSV